MPLIAATPLAKEDRAPLGSNPPGSGAGFAGIYDAPGAVGSDVRGASAELRRDTAAEARAGRGAAPDRPTPDNDAPRRSAARIGQARAGGAGSTASEGAQATVRDAGPHNAETDAHLAAIRAAGGAVPDETVLDERVLDEKGPGGSGLGEPGDVLLDGRDTRHAPDAAEVVQAAALAGVTSTPAPETQLDGTGRDTETRTGRAPTAPNGSAISGTLPDTAAIRATGANGAALPETGLAGDDNLEADVQGDLRRGDALTPGSARVMSERLALDGPEAPAGPQGLAGPAPGTRGPASASFLAAGAGVDRAGVQAEMDMAHAAALAGMSPETADEGPEGTTAPVASSMATQGHAAASATIAGRDEMRAERSAEVRTTSRPESAPEGAAPGGKDSAKLEAGAVQALAQVPSAVVPAGGEMSAAAAPGPQGHTAGSEGLFAADPLVSDAVFGETRAAQARAPVGPMPIFQSPETPRQVAMQIAEIVRASGERAVELRLQPEELGRVQLTMSQDATGTLTVSLNVERAETLDLLRRNIDLLSADLRDLGYANIDFAFQGDGSGGETSSDGAGGDGSAQGSAGTAPLAETSAAPRPPDLRRAGDGIDIRL